MMAAIRLLTLFVILLLCACSHKDVAGGITDIDHSIAGKIIDVSGKSVAHARVVAYIDNGLSIADSVETVSDENGNYEFVLKHDTAKDTVLLFAEQDSLCGLLNIEQTKNYDVKISGRKKLNGKIEGAREGYVRIKGTSLTAEVGENGKFDFESAPSGENLIFQYVQNDSAVASFMATVADSVDAVELPDFTEIYLSMEGSEIVYDNDSTIALEVDYVEGVFGNAVALRAGQFIQLNVNPTDGDFTISLWTKWFGPNGHHQILVAQRSYWSDSTSKFQWHFEGGEEKFYVMKSAPVRPEEILFGDASVLPVNEWCFVALASKNHEVSMYVNGKQIGETHTFIPNQLDVAVPFRIGGDEIETETWNGIIDEVRIESFARNF